MPTIITAPIIAENGYTIRFENNVGSTGPVMLVALWVAKNGRPVPNPQFTPVAPAATGKLPVTVPKFTDVRRLTVVASLDQGESGKLTVLNADGSEHTVEDATETTTLEMVVDP